MGEITGEMGKEGAKAPWSRGHPAAPIPTELSCVFAAPVESQGNRMGCEVPSNSNYTVIP